MVWLPTLEYNLTHPHPNSRLFLLATVIIFLVTSPVLIIVNLITLGNELVPSLQPTFQPNDTLLEGWWGMNRLPALFRPRPPRCQPKSLGRGDTFQLTPSLFDYKVLSTWDISESISTLEIRKQERAEYRGQSFSSCFINNTRIDYVLSERTQTVTVGVICNGTQDYPVHVSMETAVAFSSQFSKDFIAQYLGPSSALMGLSDPNPYSDYRKIVLAVIDVISRDSIAILRGGRFRDPVLSLSIFFSVDPRTGDTIPSGEDSMVYVSGDQSRWTDEANIYVPAIWNLVNAVNDAVKLDLGSHGYGNLYRNATAFQEVIIPNLPPQGVSSGNWSATEDSQSFYYGKLPPQYQTWAQALLAGWPIKVGTLTGLPPDSAMATTYLCPVYKVKPIGSLLASVFVGSATMILSVWGVWMVFATFLAKRIMAPRVQCLCDLCLKMQEKEEEKSKKEQAETASPAKAGLFAILAGLRSRGTPTQSASGHGDEE